MRKILAAIIFVALLPLAACGSSNSNEYGAVCVDRYTQVRYDDYRCNSSSGNYVFWYLLLNNSNRYPAVGQKVTDKSDYKTSKPKSGQVITGLSKTGGSTKDFKSSDSYKRSSKNYKSKTSTSNRSSKNKSSSSRSSSRSGGRR